MAEGRGKAQADSLRAARTDTVARLLDPSGVESEVPGAQLRVGDRVRVTSLTWTASNRARSNDGGLLAR